jgi:hypothetical protein
MQPKSVTSDYLMGIREGRETLRRCGPEMAHAELENLNATIRMFGASHPVGQLLRGERDFWRNQIKIGA